MDKTSDKDSGSGEIERLRRELAEAKAKLVESNGAITASSFTAETEIDAGVDDDGKQRWWYTIALPPSGGEGIKVNGMSGMTFYHGQRYQVYTDTLRSLKEIVYRAWKQEDLIHGQNENFYRQPTTTSMNTGRRVAI